MNNLLDLTMKHTLTDTGISRAYDVSSKTLVDIPLARLMLI